MHTPGPGRTKDTEKKLSYPRSKHASQQEIALYIFGKKTKKSNPWNKKSYPEVPSAAWLPGWTQLSAGLLEQFAGPEQNKAQLFPGVSSSFCNSPVGRAAQPQRAGSALGPAGWSLLVARTAWKGPSSKTVTAWKGPESKTETASKGPTSKTVPIARSVDLSHARCWGSCHLQPGPSLPFTSDVLL